jgi:hypothetical protein
MRLQTNNRRVTDGEHVWKTVDQYFQTYWSGLDARVYAHPSSSLGKLSEKNLFQKDIFLDEIVMLQWELQEAVMPLFSYADYTYRSLAHGARRVQGAFSINFKRDSYLFELLREIRNPQLVPTVKQSAQESEDRRHSLSAAQKGTATVEDFMALALDPGSRNDQVSSSKRFSTDAKRVEQVATDFRDAIWGRSTNKNVSPAQEAALAGMEKLTSLNGPRFEVPSGWDLRVSYGTGREGGLADERVLTGDTTRNRPFPVRIQTETRVLGMAITGVGRVTDDSGRPIMETYAFIAKDVL